MIYLHLRVSLCSGSQVDLLIFFGEKDAFDPPARKRRTRSTQSLDIRWARAGRQDFAAAPAKHRSTANLPGLGRQRARNLPLPCMGSNDARASADGTTYCNTQHKKLAIELRCVARAEKETGSAQCSDEDKGPPLWNLEAHTHKPTLTSQGGQGRRGRAFFKITPQPPLPLLTACSLSLSLHCVTLY